MATTNKCPICECDGCEEFIVDLIICNNCSHLFKKVPIEKEVILSDLHNFSRPVEKLREILVNHPSGYILEFAFPSMVFFGMEVSPSSFYRSSINHYFNQRSIIILLNRCDLKIIEQTNKWLGNMCLTNIKVIKE